MRGLRGFFPRAVLEHFGVLSLALGVLVLSVEASAQASGAPVPTSGAGGPPAWQTFVPVVFAFVVMMFLANRQNAKRQKQQQELITGLKRGDQVLTSSGILGRVEGIAETFLTLEIADGVRVKILKSQIAGPANLEAKT